MKIRFLGISETNELIELDVFEVTLTHREGEIATVEAVIPASTILQNNVILYHDQTPFFKGSLSGVPENLNDHEMKVKFVALPLDFQEQRAALTLPTHPLFATDPLEAKPFLFHADRVSHDLSLSSVLEGVQTIAFGPEILQNSLTIQSKKVPLSTVDLEVSGEWVQALEGEFDAYPDIARSFSSGMVNTLVPQGLRLSWPQEGRSLKRSGYTVVESELTPITPPGTGALNLYPTLTAPFSDGALMRRLKRYWFKGRLIFYWVYKQKRREIFTCRLTRPYKTEGQSKKITLQLQSLDAHIDKGSSHFFTTPSGREAISYAIDIAKCHLIYQSRTTIVTFKVPLEDGLQVSPNQSAHIDHPLINATGKIIAVQMIMTADHSYAQIQVAMPVEKTNWDQEVVLDLPPDEPPEIDAFIKGIQVLNDGSEQSYLLQQGCFPHLPSTEIILDLKNLQTKDTIEQIYKETTHDYSQTH